MHGPRKIWRQRRRDASEDLVDRHLTAFGPNQPRRCNARRTRSALLCGRGERRSHRNRSSKPGTIQFVAAARVEPKRWPEPREDWPSHLLPDESEPLATEEPKRSVMALRFLKSMYRNFRNSIFFPSEPEIQIVRAPTSPDAPIFVMVHGTWARDAEWTNLNQAFGKALVCGDGAHPGAFPDAGWVRFNWHAYNGAPARLQAASALAKKLDGIASQFTGAPIVAIAHSHGGNVLAWAATAIRARIECVVYLNTPFFHIKLPKRTRRGTFNQSRLISTFAILGFAPPLIGFGWLMAQIPPDPEFSFSADQVRLVLGLGAGYFVGAFGGHYLGKFIAGRITPAMEQMHRFSTAPRSTKHEVAVFSIGDEADLGLTTSTGVDRAIKGMAAAVLIAVSLVGYYIFLAAWITDNWDIPIKTLLTGGGIFLLASLVAIGGDAIVALSQGFQQGAMAIDAQIAVSAAPTDTVDFITIPWSNAELSTNIHSSIHGNQFAIAAIIQALRDRLGTEPVGRRRLPEQPPPKPEPPRFRSVLDDMK